MATIKSYTDIEQSKKLAEILPIESADGTWKQHAICGAALNVPEEMQYIHCETPFKLYSGIGCPCWSLAALLDIIRKTIGYTAYGANNVHISCELGDKPWEMETKEYDNEVDACYEMILKLNELNLL